MDNRVFKETKEDNSGAIKIDAATRSRLLNEFIPAMFEAQAERVRASDLVQTIFDDMDKKWMGTLAFTNNRAATGSSYSDVKFLFQNYIGQSPVKVVANAGLSFYNNPNPLLHQERIRDFAAAFQQVDVVLAPTVPLVAPPIGRTQVAGGPLNLVPRAIANRTTVPCNLTGMPALSVPCGFADGLPVGLQIMGPAFAERLILRVAAAYEAATEWRRSRPNVQAASAYGGAAERSST